MNLKMKTLAAAMIAAGTMGAAQASSILFPYVVNSATVTTIVSVIDIGSTVRDRTRSELHYALWFKADADAENNTAVCKEFDQWLPTSSNDIQTIDLGAHFGATTKGVLFNDPSINNAWKQSNKDFAMIKVAVSDNNKPVRGFMVVNDDIKLTTGEPALDGEAMVFEFKSGASWGYQAGRALDEDFRLDGNITFTDGQTVNFKPWGETTTKFLVTPIDEEMLTSGNNRGNVTIFLNRTSQTNIGEVATIYDRDENPYSGKVDQSVVCVGSVNATTMLSSGALNSVPDGGWGRLNASIGTGISTASVIKLDYNSKLTFNGEAVTGTFNNAFQLR